MRRTGEVWRSAAERFVREGGGGGKPNNWLGVPFRSGSSRKVWLWNAPTLARAGVRPIELEGFERGRVDLGSASAC